MRILHTYQKFKPWLSSLSDLVFPPLCPSCKNPLISDENWLCLACEMRLPIAPFLLNNANPIHTLFKGRLNLEFGTSFLLFSKEGIAQHLIHALKYKDNTKIGVELGRLFGIHLKGKVDLPEALIPVPLHPNKEKKRGYNQSTFIAQGIGEVLKIPVNTTLVQRIKENPSQTKLTRFARWENVREIFSCSTKVPYKYVWIIDDTLTTGSTLEACALALQNKSNVKIGVATLAFAD